MQDDFLSQALYLLPPEVLPVASAALAGASNQRNSGLGLHVSLLARCMTRGSFGFRQSGHLGLVQSVNVDHLQYSSLDWVM